MSVTVGPATFDGATGTPQTVISPAMAAAWAAAARAFRWKGSLSTACGGMSAWLDCDAATAAFVLQQARAYIGERVSVSYPHYTWTDVPLASVEGEWQTRAGTVNGGVLVCAFTFDSAEENKDDPEDKTSVKVQTASALGGTWTDQDWVCMSDAEGIGSYIGESEAYVDGAAPAVARVGEWVRILDRASPYTIRWHGVIVGVSSVSRTGGEGAPKAVRTTYRFAGVGYAFDQVFFPVWYEDNGEEWTPEAHVADAVGDVGEPLPYNGDMGGSNKGTQSLALTEGGASVSVHSRGRPDPNRWTALQACQNLFAHAAANWPAFPEIVLNHNNLLGFSDVWETRRKSLFRILCDIIAADHGVTFRLSVDYGGGGGAARIIVDVSDITIAGTAIDWTTIDTLEWSADFDGAQEVDAFYIEGPRFTYVHTLRYTVDDGTYESALGKGWLAADGTTWDAADDDGKAADKLGAVWRRFFLRWSWDGFDYLEGYSGNHPVPNKRSVDANNEETGVLEYDGGAIWANPRTAFAFDRTLPTGPGKDWTATGSSLAPITPREPKEGPLVWTTPDEDASGDFDPLHYAQQVAVGDDACALVIGREVGDAKANRDKLETDEETIFATVGLIHPLRVRVSALEVSPPRTDVPRSGFYYLDAEYYQQIYTTDRAMVGLDDARKKILAAFGKRSGGDLTEIRQKMRSYRLTPDGSARWSAIGIESANVPGAVVGTASVLLDGAGTAASIVLGVPVTRRARSYDLRAPRTEWTANRIVPGLRIPQIVRRGGVNGALHKSKYEAEATRRTTQGD